MASAIYHRLYKSLAYSCGISSSSIWQVFDNEGLFALDFVTSIYINEALFFPALLLSQDIIYSAICFANAGGIALPICCIF